MAEPESESITADRQWRRPRAESLGTRLVSGAGALSFIAYREPGAPVVDALAHGLSESGLLLVAGRPMPDSWEAGLADGTTVDVRLDIMKGAVDPRAEITAAGLHLLGEFVWLSPEETTRLLSDEYVPSLVAEMASLAGGRLGVVRGERALLHDSYGITALAYADLATAGRRGAFPTLYQEWDAYDIVAACGTDSLKDLYNAVCEGAVAGDVLVRRKVAVCPHHDDVFCVDVDRFGALLMRVAQGVARPFSHAFPQRRTPFTD